MFGTAEIELIAVYMPNVNQAEGSLQQQLNISLNVEDVQQHIRQIMEDNILAAQSQQCNIITGGDFNSNLFNNDSTKMAFLLDELHMQHSATDLQRKQATYVRGIPNSNSCYIATRPDHILHYGESISPKMSIVYDHSAFINDHKPLIASFQIKNQINLHHNVLQAIKRVT